MEEKNSMKYKEHESSINDQDERKKTFFGVVCRIVVSANTLSYTERNERNKSESEKELLRNIQQSFSTMIFCATLRFSIINVKFGRKRRVHGNLYLFTFFTKQNRKKTYK